MVEGELLNQLINAATRLASAARLVVTNMPEQYQGALDGPTTEMELLLSELPAAAAPFDGTIRDEDIAVTRYTPDRPNAGVVACKVTHLPTRISGASESKRTFEENEAVAREYVVQKVAKEFAAGRI